MKKFISLLSGLIILTVSSCGPKPGSTEAALKIRKDQIEKNNKKVTTAVDNIPQWCLSPPVSDFALAACGSGESASMNMAKSRAILRAKREIADMVNSMISARMNDFNKAIGMGSNEQVQEASEIVIKNTTIEAQLIGYKQTKIDAQSLNGKYKFYVLLEYPLGEANQALLNQIKNDEVLSTQKNADKAMADLEADIEKARKNNN
jgi:hypothetical protein